MPSLRPGEVVGGGSLVPGQVDSLPDMRSWGLVSGEGKRAEAQGTAPEKRGLGTPEKDKVPISMC